MKPEEAIQNANNCPFCGTVKNISIFQSNQVMYVSIVGYAELMVQECLNIACRMRKINLTTMQGIVLRLFKI